MITNCLTSDPIQPSSLVRYVLPPHHNNYITLVFLSLSLRAAATSPWYARAHRSPLFFFFLTLHRSPLLPNSMQSPLLLFLFIYLHHIAHQQQRSQMAEGGNDGSVAGDRLMVATIKRKRELAEEDGDSSSPCSANRSLDMEVVEEKLYCSYGEY